MARVLGIHQSKIYIGKDKGSIPSSQKAVMDLKERGELLLEGFHSLLKVKRKGEVDFQSSRTGMLAMTWMDTK